MAKERLSIVMNWDKINTYHCKDCHEHGIEHKIIDIAGPYTDQYSCWGKGIPTTMRRCTACNREDGPWVSTAIVGDGY
jgi:hypothetical protein